MKKYMLTIKKIEVIEMLVSADSSKQAIKKVDSFFQTCVKNKINLQKIFVNKPSFKYKIVRTNQE